MMLFKILSVSVCPHADMQFIMLFCFDTRQLIIAMYYITYILIFVFFAHNETSLYLVKQFYKEVFVLSNVRIFKHRKRHQPFD